MRSLTGLCWLFALGTAQAGASPYWIAYEGNDFPENEAWERRYGDENGHGQGGSNRSIVDSVLVLDSMRNHLIYDSYFVHRQVNPGAGELFVADWRLRVDQSVGPLADVGFTIARDGMGTLSFGFRTDSVRSEREHWTYPLVPGLFHTFRLESTDMLSYSLWSDGTLIANGTWDLNSFNESYVAFGDATYGGGVRSYSEWDYVRFGVVPEPDSPLLALGGLCLLALRRNL